MAHRMCQVRDEVERAAGRAPVTCGPRRAVTDLHQAEIAVVVSTGAVAALAMDDAMHQPDGDAVGLRLSRNRAAEPAVAGPAPGNRCESAHACDRLAAATDAAVWPNRILRLSSVMGARR